MTNKKRSIMKSREHSLLLHSEITNEHQWFKSYLQKHKKITYEMVENLTNEEQIFINKMLQSIIKSASEEWIQDSSKPVEDLGPKTAKSQWKQCSLCPEKDNRYVFYIKNRLNGKILNVGSTCITHFGFKGTKSIDQLKKEARESRFWHLLEIKFPGIRDNIFTWENKLDQYPLMIPNHLEDPYLNLRNEIDQLIENFIEDKMGDSVFSEIGTLLEKQNIFLNRILKYVQSNKDNIYVPTKNIEKWLISNNEYDTLKRLKKDSLINLSTIWKIKEPTFMKRMIPLLNELLQNLNINVTDIKNQNYVLEYQLRPGRNLVCTCSHNFLLLEYGYCLFGQPPVSELNIANLLTNSILDTENSFEIILGMLEQLLRRKNIYVHYSDLQYNDIIFRTKTKYFKLDNMKQILNKYKHVAFGNDTINSLCDKILSTKPIHQDDVKELIDNRLYPHRKNDKKDNDVNQNNIENKSFSA